MKTVKFRYSPALLRTHVCKYTKNIQSQAGKDRWAGLALLGILYAQIILSVVFYFAIQIIQVVAHRYEADTFTIISLNLTFTAIYLFYAILGYQAFRNRYQAVRRYFKASRRLKRIKSNPYLGFEDVPVGEGKKK